MATYDCSSSTSSSPVWNTIYRQNLYGVLQNKWFEEHPDIKLGSEVIVNATYCFLTNYERNEFHWGLGYPFKLDSMIGNKVTINSINPINGLLLHEKIHSPYTGCWFPFYTVDVNPIDLFILFPDGTTKKIKNLVAGHRIVANVILNYKIEDNIYFVQDDRKISAFDLYNKFLDNSPRIFLNSVALF